MSALKKFLQSTSAKVLLGVVLVVSVMTAVNVSLERFGAAGLKKSEAVLAFEQDVQPWLDAPITLAELHAHLKSKNVSAVAYVPSTPGLFLVTLKSGEKSNTRLPGCNSFQCDNEMLKTLADYSVEQNFPFVPVEADTRSSAGRLGDTVAQALPPLLYLLTLGVLFYFLMQLQFKMNPEKIEELRRPDVRFDDVVGNDEAKAQLLRAASFLTDSSVYTELNARAPKGVLLAGPPGTGKTLLAKALAGETGVNFLAVDGSYFTAMFYGVGAMKVKSLFARARKMAPCILFIDEIDGIGRRVTSGDMRGPEAEGNRTINRLLTELDGFNERDGVIVIGATNHEAHLDPALLRPGRFDSRVQVTLPTLPHRKAVFELYLSKVRAAAELDTEQLARMTAGASPADIANIVNKATSTAAEEGSSAVENKHLLKAIETFSLGGEVSALKSLMTQETRVRVAYHEAGHALVAHKLGLGTVERLTIEPRGQALGVTHVSRGSEDPLYRQGELTHRLSMMLAGREAELLVLKDVSSGASDDLKRATELAASMVSKLGFSPDFGVLSIEGLPSTLVGPELQSQVLKATRALLEESQQLCARLLKENRGQLEALAQALLSKEVLTGEELEALLGT